MTSPSSAPPTSPPENDRPPDRTAHPLLGAAQAAGRLGWRLNLILFLATIVSTTYAIGSKVEAGSFGQRLAEGLAYSVPVILILGSHEMGHYVLCRRRGVEATLPYFIPAPPILLFGTFGAVIRMRPPIPSRKALFDIGIAGPIAGFVVAVPVLIYGIGTADVTRVPEGVDEIMIFGDSALTKLLVLAIRGPLPRGTDLVMNGPFLAGWFGLLVTAMNLFPVHQLDGGHVAYALSPRVHRALARITVAGMIALVSGTLLSPFTALWPVAAAAVVALWSVWPAVPRSGRLPALAAIAATVLYCGYHGAFTAWTLWTIVLVWLGRRPHPPVQHEEASIGPLRIALGVGGAAIFLLAFIPSPLQVFATTVP